MPTPCTAYVHGAGVRQPREGNLSGHRALLPHGVLAALSSVGPCNTLQLCPATMVYALGYTAQTRATPWHL